MHKTSHLAFAMLATSVTATLLPRIALAQVDDLELPAEPVEPVPEAEPVPSDSASEPPPSTAPPEPGAPEAPTSSETPSEPPPASAPGANAASVSTAVKGEGAMAASTSEASTSPEPRPAAKAASPGAGVALERYVHSRPVGRGLEFGGYVQAQFTRDQLSEDQLQQDGSPLNRDEFSLRAARLRVDSGYEYTAYALELDATTLNGPRVGIRRAEAMLLYRGENADELPPLLGLSAGVIDVPFGHELVESSGARHFMERTTASEALFPTQTDAGVKLFGAWRFLRYSVGFVNGEPLTASTLRDPNAKKESTGRLGAEANIGPHVALAGGTSFSFGRGFHPGRLAQKDNLAWRDDNEDGVATPGELIGVPGSSATPSENFERWVLGLDLALQFTTPLGLSSLLAEGYVASNHDRGLYVSDPVQTGVDVRQLGAHASVTQSLSRYAIVGFRAAVYDPNTDFLEQRRGDLVPRSQQLLTLSPLVGLTWPESSRLLFQYDFVDDELARDRVGVPTDAKNDRWTVRLQVQL